MVKVKTKSPKRYFIRISDNPLLLEFTTLKLARKYVRENYSKFKTGQVMPKTVEIIKQVIVEEVMDVFTPQPMQLLMVTDLDKDLYK